MDEIVRMIAADGTVRAVAITGKDMAERARQIHKTLPVATAALGRTLMGCAMMGSDLKTEDGSVTLRIQGGGPLGSITAVADSHGNARGYLQNGQVRSVSPCSSIICSNSFLPKLIRALDTRSRLQ